eukprot:12797138-Prorocentrum_lima.AAC.1
MCIRDRNKTATEVPSAVQSMLAELNSMAGEQRVVSSAPMQDLCSGTKRLLSCSKAVSYTHLTLPTICSV